MGKILHRRLGALAIAIVVAACGSSAPSSPPATASTHHGDLRLDLYIDRSVWRVGDLVTGTTFLVNTSGSTITAYGSSMGLVAYDFREVGGTRVLTNVMTADCGLHDLPFGGLTYRLLANAGSSSDPSDAWLVAADDQQGARLPAGTWDVTARAQFAIGDCQGTPVLMQATARITVLP